MTPADLQSLTAEERTRLLLRLERLAFPTSDVSHVCDILGISLRTHQFWVSDKRAPWWACYVLQDYLPSRETEHEEWEHVVTGLRQLVERLERLAMRKVTGPAQTSDAATEPCDETQLQPWP